MRSVIETAYDAYLRIREDWQSLLDAPDAPMRSEAKDALFTRLARAWSRLSMTERKCAGMHCRLMYH